MGSRLPPGEAERRAKERARKTWSGENYRKFDPKTGFGSADQWAGTAKAFADGDVLIAGEVRQPPINADLAYFGLSEMPETDRDLAKAQQRARKALFAHFGSDTAVGYADAFITLTEAYDRIRMQQRW